MPWYCWRSPPGWSFVAMCPDSPCLAAAPLTGAAAKHPSADIQDVLYLGAVQVMPSPSIRICRRRVSAPSPRISRSLSVMCSVSWRVPAGGARSRQPWTARCTLRRRAHGARRPGRRQGTRHPAWRALLPGGALLPAPTGDPPGSPPGSHPPLCMAGVRVRCSQPRVSRPYQLRPFVAQN